ncbi:hypothetical protein MK372_01145, partial [Streptococcus oralis]|nr:hypothetical protein [Streptococcus oralis]
LKARFIWQFMG